MTDEAAMGDTERYSCDGCGDEIEGEEYVIHQLPLEYHVYHVGCTHHIDTETDEVADT